MGSLIVQVAQRSARGPEFTRTDGQPLSVGRAFSNDIVINDPFVAARQLLLACGDNGWTVQILDRTNAVTLNGETIVGETAAIASGDRLTIGRTDVLLFDEYHPVDPTRKLLLSSWLAPNRVGPLIAFGVLGLVCALDVAAEFLQSAVDLEWKQYAYAGLFSAAVSLLWAGAWAITGRVLRHQPNFFAQLLVTALVSAGLTVIYPWADYIEFATSSVTVGRATNYLIALGSVGLLLKLNLLFATNLRRTTQVAFAVSSVIVGLVYAGERYAETEFEAEPVYSAVVKPPFAHITANRSIDAFLKQVADISTAP